ncbi:ABC transporter ATP-binding protein [Clostridium saudiense]|uniref:ABC transporter ATP-binding protein n=1 Tax=Clostridium saudiense TaxID=1414720 RepID=A0ABS2FER6_9CLOT|nr:ABC transporter ATP-binding protein [Clostridium saudiense]MBM6819055.1 ABC transporter ATP-binding protein [Clostridium saudiense]
MENLKKLKPSKDLWVKIKWMGSYAKPAVPFLIFSIIVNIIFAVIGIYNVTVSKSLIDSAISGDSEATIRWLIIMLSITLISMLSSPVTSFISTHSSTKLTQNIQRKIYQHIQCSDWLEQSKFHSVSLLTRVTSDVSNISSAILGTIPSLVSLTVTLVGSFYTLISWAPSIAFAAVFIGPFLILVGKYFSRKLKDLYKEAQEEDVKYRSFMQESIQNIMIVKTFCMEKINMHRLVEIQNNKYKIAMRNTKLSVMTSMSMSFCSSIAYFTIFTWGVLNIAKGVSTYGTFTGMLQLYSKVQAPFSSLASMIPGLISTIAAAERLMEIEAIPVEKMADEKELDDIGSLEVALDSISSKVSSTFNKPNIVFDNVSFAYKANNNILNNINLTIDAGETIAFVGPSGEGKTTMIRLILSLINPTEGNILLSEGNLVKEINRNYRELISYVPQGNTLFPGSIRDNLKYGNPYASDDEIKAALKNACALDFVNELEDGLDTMIGEKGVGISEGQAQRIAIARSFLRERPILILDEATSALDPETEVNVLKAVRALPTKPTCIIITHRPSALNICNRIIKLEKGNLREVSRESILEVASELV